MNATCPPQLRPGLSRLGFFTRAVVMLAVASAPVVAQDRTVAKLGREAVQYADRVMLSSTLEIALLGVSGVSDAQRDTIERFEQELRDRVVQLGAPIRRARRNGRAGWPAELS